MGLDPYELNYDDDENDPYDDFSESADDMSGWSEPEPAPLHQPHQPPYSPQQNPYGQGPSHTALSCRHCGYNLTGATIGGNCPECGASVGSSIHSAIQPTQTNGCAITSMILGICSVVSSCCCGCVSIPLAVTGLIFGIIALGQIKQGHYTDGSRGMAIAGVVCSGVSIVLTAIMFLLSMAGGFAGP